MKTIKYKYDFINPTANDNPKWDYIPGFRGANQMIIYTNDYMYKTKDNQTGVNPWGFEAAINSKGFVVTLSDRVKIPKNGFVISGNGRADNFIQKNVLLGSKVNIDKNTNEIIVITDKLKSLCLTFKKEKRNAIKRYNAALKNAFNIDIEKINKNLIIINEYEKKLNKAIINKDSKTFNKIYKKSLKIFDLLYLLTSNSRKISSRNVWTRPCEQSLDEIIKMLNVCQKCNINGIYVESFYNGDIPGISKITETNEEVINGNYGIYGKDYLKALITEAHKRSIEVHAWVECFFVGEKHTQWKKRYKDEWHMVNYDNSTIQGNNDEGNEMDFVWLDPANPECLNYVLSIYKELLTNYDFDGINVDYVRYPHGNFNLYSSNGYTKYAMNEFKKINNLSGDVKKLVEDKNIYDLWTKYRCDKITLLMKEIRKLVNEVKPNCLISTAVCSDINYAINNKMQNWKLWARSGWLDLTLPMAYYIGCSEIAVATKELVNFNKGNAFSYTGLMSMVNDLPSILVVQQINTTFKNKADGYALFHLGDIIDRKEIQKYLKLSVNRVKAIHPHANPSVIIKETIKELINKQGYYNSDISKTILDLKNIKDYSLNSLIVQINEITKKCNNNILKKELEDIKHYFKVQKELKKHSMVK